MIIKISLVMVLISCYCLLLFAQEDTLETSMKRGEEVYAANCAGCHQPAGEGMEGVYPPLAKSDYLKNQERAIGIILHGQECEITVNGKQYNSFMAGFSQLSDREVADVLNFVSNSWGNKNPVIKSAQIKKIRK
ncbi:MAG: cytochrome c [Ferruginibacter sp.]